MAKIDVLQIGCTSQDLIATINALIAAHNDREDSYPISYNDLADKPVINGVELKDELTTASLFIRIAGTEDYDLFEQAWATKEYVDSADRTTLEKAEESVQESLDAKLDKDLGNLADITALSEDDYITVVTADGLRKVKVNNLANNVAVRTVSIDSLSKSVDNQLSLIDLNGEQDGENVTFTPTSAFVAGTSHLFLNGQRLVAGTDYTENNGRSITLLSYTPKDNDSLIFIAVKR